MEETLVRLMSPRLIPLALIALAALASVHALAQEPAGASGAEPVAEAYLYLEPFEARAEAIFNLGTVLQWMQRPAPASGEFDAAQQKELREHMLKFAADWCKLLADDQESRGGITSCAFIKGKPGATLPVPEGEAVRTNEALVGIVFEFPISGGPAKIELRWKELLQPVTKLPLTIFFGPLSEKRELTSTLPAVRWMNDNRLPKPKPLAQVPKIPVPEIYEIPLVMIVWILFGVALYIYMEIRDRKFPGGIIPFIAAWVLGIALTWNMTWSVRDPFAASVPVISTPAQAEEILQPLLKNVYRAFDYRKEQDIYDRLEHSVAGDLLRKLYLQTVQALTLEGQDGTRAHVTDLSVDVGSNADRKKSPDWKSKPDPSVAPQASGFIAECEWTAMGNVGHWGHSHPRVNRYKARVTLNPVQGEWKLTGLEVLEERRM